MRTLMMVIKSSSMNLESGQRSLPPPQGHFQPTAEHRGLHALVKYVGCAPWGCDLFGGARGSHAMDSHVQLRSSCARCSTWAGRKEPLELLTACPEKWSRTGAWPWVFMVEMTLMLTQSCRAPRTVQTLWEHTHGCCALLQRVFSSDDAIYGLFHDSCQCNVIFHSNKS
ncbi:uncharacterized protein LOC128141314 isoform X2 [Harpia harpyja]|uniref:uncharacterized protein LOC128141314 isoform X2 n=1 Tax=Harpia harpyja TaxID=202280 RepID=UPI0022B17C5D|nr:uncharacterized protein LOC128141314 isoform X2 [Harpia harpyja]